MKNRFFLKTLLCLISSIFLIPCSSISQSRLIFGGGISFPSNPSTFSDTYKTGVNLEFGVLGAPTLIDNLDNVDVEFSVTYNTFGLSIPEGSNVSGGRLNLLTAKFGGRYYLGEPEVGKTNFYLGAGYGRYSMRVSDLKGTDFKFKFDEQTGNSLNFGVGIIMPSNYFWNFDLRHKTIYTKGEHNLSFITLRLILFFV